MGINDYVNWHTLRWLWYIQYKTKFLRY